MSVGPMMACGHSANAEQTMSDGTTRPACVICIGIDPGASTVVEPPSLDGRKARCSYNRTNEPGKRGGGRSGTTCSGEVDSHIDLAFFEHRPGEPFDLFYCGCRGWD